MRSLPRALRGQCWNKASVSSEFLGGETLATGSRPDRERETGGARFAGVAMLHSRGFCGVNTSTEWRRETLIIRARCCNRLREDLNLAAATRRFSLINTSGPDHQWAAFGREFLLRGSFKANSKAHCVRLDQKK
jgi:hypothetical protein